MDFTVETLASILFPTLHILLGIVCVIHILGSGKRASPTILWILVVIYLPWIGAILYMIFGIDVVGRRLEKRQLRRKRIDPALRELPHLDDGSKGECRHKSLIEECPQPFDEFFQLLDNLCGIKAVAGNRCQLMRGGEQVFEAMGQAIDAATHSVHLMTYILDDDQVGRALSERLQRRAQAGVEVRVLVDGYGSNMFAFRQVRRFRRSGVNMQLLRQFDLLQAKVAINLRNHRKIMVCDGRVAFIGGMNISARHLLEGNRPRPVIDHHARIDGPVVNQLQAVFAEDWFDVTSESILDRAYFPDVPVAGSDVVRTINTGPDHMRHVLLKVFCAAIQAAARSIHIVTPYFVPDPAILMHLQLAALGGVETVIILPEANNHPEIKFASRYRYVELMKAGVKIYERRAPFSHSKLFLVDDAWASVGSANWDMRTFHLQFDTNVGVVSPDFVSQVRTAINDEIAASERIRFEEFLPRPRIRGALERAASLFEDLL